MSGQIRRFIMRKMHGNTDVDLSIEGNRLIIVGVNGMGKSTFINALYCLLSRQWSRLATVDFESLV